MSKNRGACGCALSPSSSDLLTKMAAFDAERRGPLLDRIYVAILSKASRAGDGKAKGCFRDSSRAWADGSFGNSCLGC